MPPSLVYAITNNTEVIVLEYMDPSSFQVIRKKQYFFL